MKEDSIISQATRRGLRAEPWGARGPQSYADLEALLGVQLGPQLREFILELGNLRVDPFSILVAGDTARRVSASLETRYLWERSSDLKTIRAVAVMEHAGEAYVYLPHTEEVVAYDSAFLNLGEETRRFASFGAFLDWILDEAAAFQSRSPDTPS